MALQNLNSLRVFDAAARHLNFRLAADELHLTQGAVAQRVRRLESELGLKLFERHARGLTFTDAGRRFHAPVRRALTILEDATQTLKPSATRITLSVTPSFASKWLVPRLGRLAEMHPDIELQTVADEGLADFRTDGVDIAIRHGEPPSDARFDVALLAPLDAVAVCCPSTAGRLGTVVSLEAFSEQRLFDDAHGLWSQLFEAAGLPRPRRVTRFNQTALATDAAATGDGIALAPRLLVAADLESGRLREIWSEPPSERAGFYIVTPHVHAHPQARDRVVSWLKAEANGGTNKEN